MEGWVTDRWMICPFFLKFILSGLKPANTSFASLLRLSLVLLGNITCLILAKGVSSHTEDGTENQASAQFNND